MTKLFVGLTILAGFACVPSAKAAYPEFIAAGGYPSCYASMGIGVWPASQPFSWACAAVGTTWITYLTPGPNVYAGISIAGVCPQVAFTWGNFQWGAQLLRTDVYLATGSTSVDGWDVCDPSGYCVDNSGNKFSC
jgi:hypothetical protein